jgi:hypothetical protein
MVRGGANIGIAGGSVKQKILSTSQIIPKQTVRVFLHHDPQIVVLISVNNIRN